MKEVCVCMAMETVVETSTNETLLSRLYWVPGSFVSETVFDRLQHRIGKRMNN